MRGVDVPGSRRELVDLLIEYDCGKDILPISMGRFVIGRVHGFYEDPYSFIDVKNKVLIESECMARLRRTDGQTQFELLPGPYYLFDEDFPIDKPDPILTQTCVDPIVFPLHLGGAGSISYHAIKLYDHKRRLFLLFDH